jgi:hypothetical protein
MKGKHMINLNDNSVLCKVMVMLFNATFNNVLVISWGSALLVGKLEFPGNTTNLSQFTEKLHHIMFYWVYLAISGIRTQIVCGDMH